MTKRAASQTHMLAAAGFFVLTIGLGLLMRWDMSNGMAARAGFQLANLRHAHSHAGYYGVLTLAWWSVEKLGGLSLAPRFTAFYVASAALATVAFAFMGYRPLTIALSTVIAGAWLWIGFRHWQRRAQPAWLDVAPYGLVFSVLLVPVIAIMAKRDFALSRELAHVFIAAVLLTVFVPAAWQTQGLKRGVSLLAYLPLALGASACAVFAAENTLLAAAVTIAFATLVSWVVLTEPLSPQAKLGWLLLPAAFTGAALVPAVQGSTWRIAGLHLLILGPVLAAFFADKVRGGLRALYVITLVGMVVSIVAPERLWPAHPAHATALSSSIFAAVALASALRQLEGT